jgi:hypothetical protein
MLVPSGVETKPTATRSSGGSSEGQHLADAALELIFEQLNIDVPEHDWAIAYREAGHRSFSIGDVAVVGETAFACDSGWTRISADDLAAALAH